MKKLLLFMLLAAFTSGLSAQGKFLGGDISMLPKYEEAGSHYLDADGAAVTDVLGYLKEQGMNAMRVRLFVDPTKASDDERSWGAVQDLDYVKALGKRIKAAGLAFMLDLHYSDTWADPSNQTKPDAWKTLTAEQLATQVYDYTAATLQSLIDAEATPDYIQVGNEVNLGMLWNDGKTGPWGTGTEMTNLINFVKQACKACRDKCPDAGIVFHIAMNYDTDNNKIHQYAKGWPKTLADNSVDYDIIGLSYYPDNHGDLTSLDNLLTYLETNFSSKRIQIVETAYPHTSYPDDAKFNYTSTYPATETGQKNYAIDLIKVLNKHSSVNGLYWWWPEANEYWRNDGAAQVTANWYNKGLWDNNTGKATAALYELNRFVGGSGGSYSDWYLYGYKSGEQDGDLGRFKITDEEGIFVIDACQMPLKGFNVCVHDGSWTNKYGWSDEGGSISATGTAVKLGAGSTTGWFDLAAGTYKVTWNATDQTIQFDVQENTNPVSDTPIPTELKIYDKTGTSVLATLSAVSGSNGVFAGKLTITEGWQNFSVVDTENNIWYGTDPASSTTLSTAEGNYKFWIASDVIGTYNIEVNLNTMTWTHEQDTTTGIGAVRRQQRGTVYNIQGQRVRTALSTLPAGVYVVNGKKYVKK